MTSRPRNSKIVKSRLRLTNPCVHAASACLTMNHCKACNAGVPNVKERRFLGSVASLAVKACLTLLVCKLGLVSAKRYYGDGYVRKKCFLDVHC